MPVAYPTPQQLPSSNVAGHTWCFRCCHSISNKRWNHHQTVCTLPPPPDECAMGVDASSTSAGDAAPAMPRNRGICDGTHRITRLDHSQRHEALLAHLKNWKGTTPTLRDIQFLRHTDAASLSEPQVHTLLHDEHRVRISRTARVPQASRASHTPCTCGS